MSYNYLAPECVVVRMCGAVALLQGSPLSYGSPGGAGSGLGYNEYDIDF